MQIDIDIRSPAIDLDLDKIVVDVDIGYGVVEVPPERHQYQGGYEVTPAFAATVLPTAEKYLERDVTVYEIPVHEVSNPQGGTTVTIGDVSYGSQ